MAYQIILWARETERNDSAWMAIQPGDLPLRPGRVGRPLAIRAKDKGNYPCMNENNANWYNSHQERGGFHGAYCDPYDQGDNRQNGRH